MEIIADRVLSAVAACDFEFTLKSACRLRRDLAAVALIGYLFGNRTRTKIAAAIDERRQQELDRAARIAWQLETIATGLRQDLVTHHSQLATFKRQLQTGPGRRARQGLGATLQRSGSHARADDAARPSAFARLRPNSPAVRRAGNVHARPHRSADGRRQRPGARAATAGAAERRVPRQRRRLPWRW